MVAPAQVWRPLGGHLALDLCNTVSRRFTAADRIDRIASVPDLVEWHQLVRPSAPPLTAADVTAADLAGIRGLREATTAVLDAQVAGEALPSRPLTLIVREYREHIRTCTAGTALPLTLGAGGSGGSRLRRELAAAVVDLLRHVDVDRLRRCEGDGCGWFFLDRTRNRSRRWCDPADCGNRHRVRAYARRHADRGH